MYICKGLVVFRPLFRRLGSFCTRPWDNHHPSLGTSQRMLNLVGGFNPSEKYDFVSWDDIPNIWKNKIHVPNHQPVIILPENNV